MTPQTLDDLGLPGAVYLWSLLHAQQHRLALAPTAELSREILQVLATHEVLVLDTEESSTPVQLTPLEGIRWRWIWRAYHPSSALPALEDFLSSVTHEELVLTLGVALWQRLLRDEAQA